MTRRFGLHPDARRFDLVAALAYYDKIDADLGNRFLDDYQDCLDFVERYPLAGRILFGEYRRRAFSRFPYLLVYTATDEQIRVLGLLHARRDPASIQSQILHRR
ncbi:MAG: type II toxin-antitoxin system RelE/ParE family toxin [Frankiaceae bacterium]|jgi:plasmid stabilization system protein ParE|nr:type II toxin-antitoxin system RelE/ParE family toxin [Frankiaceae bacterium]